jgi:hypothetical protein
MRWLANGACISPPANIKPQQDGPLLHPLSGCSNVVFEIVLLPFADAEQVKHHTILYFGNA